VAIFRNEYANVTITYAFISALLTCQCYTTVAILDKGHEGPSHGCQHILSEQRKPLCQMSLLWINKWLN